MGAPARPGPPSVNGINGLIPIIRNFQPSKTQEDVLNHIIDFIQTTEKPIVVAFENQTAPAVSQPIDQLMAEHEQSVFETERAQVESVPDAIEATRAQIEAFYKVKLTLATPFNTDDSVGSARVTAPLIPASEVLGVPNHTDMIRVNYPLETLAAGLSPIVDLDPINFSVHDSRVWHPAIPAYVDPSLQDTYPGLRDSYVVTCNLPGDPGWGHIYAYPLEHFIHERVNRDMQQIQRDYMAALDNARQQLAQDIRQMLGIPTAGQLNIAGLPGQIPDDTPTPGAYRQIKNAQGVMVWVQDPTPSPPQ